MVRTRRRRPASWPRKGQGPVDYILIILLVSYIRVLRHNYDEGRQHRVREPAATLNEDVKAHFEAVRCKLRGVCAEMQQQRNLSDFTSECCSPVSPRPRPTKFRHSSRLGTGLTPSGAAGYSRSIRVLMPPPKSKEIHQNVLDGVVMSCRFELGFDDNGKRIVQKDPGTIVEGWAGRCAKKEVVDSTDQRHRLTAPARLTAASRSLLTVSSTFSSGLYLSRMIQLPAVSSR